MALSSDEINFLLYRYLIESGFVHSAFTFAHESFITKTSVNTASVPPGALISFVQKGLQYTEIETHIHEDGTETVCQQPFSLLAPHKCRPPSDNSAQARRRLFDPFEPLQDHYGDLELQEEECVQLRGHSGLVTWCAWRPGGDSVELVTVAMDGQVHVFTLENFIDTANRMPTLGSLFRVAVATAAAAASSASSSGSAANSKMVVDNEAEQGSADHAVQEPDVKDDGLCIVPRRSISLQPEPAVGGKRSFRMASDDPAAAVAAGPGPTATAAATEDDSPRAKKKLRTLVTAESGANGQAPAEDGESLQPPSSGGRSDQIGVLYSAWDATGSTLAIAGADGTVVLADAQGSVISRLAAHRGPCVKVCWSKPGFANGELQQSFLLSCGVDRTIAVWTSGELVQRWSYHEGPVLDIDWQPVTGSQTFLSCGGHQEVFLGRVGRDSPIRAFQGHAEEVNMVRWSQPIQPIHPSHAPRLQGAAPASVMFATCSDDRSVKVWSAGTGSLLQTLLGHRRAVTCIEWLPCPLGTPKHPDFSKSPLNSASPQERTTVSSNSSNSDSSDNASSLSLLASGSLDATVRIWNPVTGACVCMVTSHSHPITQLSFSSRCGWLASGAHDRVHVWDLWDGSLVKTFRAGAGVTRLSWYFSSLDSATAITLVGTEPGKKALVRWQREQHEQGDIAEVKRGSVKSSSKGSADKTPERTFDFLAMAFANGDVFVAEVDDDRE